VNDQQQPYGPYDPYYGQPQIVGYDEYGRPVYQQQAPAQQQAPEPQQGYGQAQYDAYGRQVPGYDPYAQPQQQPEPPQQQQAAQQQAGPQHPQQYDPYASQGQQQYGYDTGQQPAVVDTGEQWSIPQQQARAARQPAAPAPPGQRDPELEEGQDPTGGQQRVQRSAPVPGQRSAPEQDYGTEQFSFIEEPDEDSEDVIDWLKFTESRSERREEAKRRGRRRFVALIVVLAVALVAGVGYLWYEGKVPGVDGSAKKGTAAPGAQKRDVIVVHLHNTVDKSTSTALLVNNETTGQGTTVLLPNSLAVSNDDGTATTLGKSVDDDGSDGTRESIGNLLGTKVAGTWRLDTPYLENLVDLVGTVDVDTDVDVPDTKKGAPPVVHRGKDQTLSGKMAVAYATYHASGETDDKQLQRFGQVLQATLRKISDDPKAATITVQTLAQILDPSLTESDLGAALAKLAKHAKEDDYKTVVLPVQAGGALSPQGGSEVKDILGGSVSAPDESGVLRIGVKNATGDKSAMESARVTLINAGYNVIDGGTGSTASTSTVTYTDAKNKAQATDVATTLGLPATAVRKGTAAGADISVVLGGNFKPKSLGDGGSDTTGGATQ
jgi:anionic cell wall polymer biosynthesis LytR-Cps2A-Psr (LCP) family protein